MLIYDFRFTIMIQTILEFLNEVALRHSRDVLMAWVQFIPAAVSALTAGYGAIQQGKKNREMRGMVNRMGAENQAMFNADYYGDYTQRADAQNIIRQMREQMDRQTKRDNNTAVITGGTVEAQAAAKEGRNRAMSNLFGNLAAHGQRFKDRAKDRYMHRKAQIDNMLYGQLAEESMSAGNLLYNGIGGLAGTDWAGILGGGKPNLGPSPAKIENSAISPLQTANPIKNVSGIIPKYKSPFG